MRPNEFWHYQNQGKATLNPHSKNHNYKNRTFPEILICLLLVVSFWAGDLLAVDCSSGFITLRTQTEVDDFQASFGGGGYVTL